MKKEDKILFDIDELQYHININRKLSFRFGMLIGIMSLMTLIALISCFCKITITY